LIARLLKPFSALRQIRAIRRRTLAMLSFTSAPDLAIVETDAFSDLGRGSPHPRLVL
jgi:hypothetical protein